MSNQISLEGKKWIKDEAPEEDGEIIKLEIGEQIVGILTDKKPSKKYQGHFIYTIQVKDDPVQKIIIGTTILDQWMKNRSIGDEVLIKRLPDIPTDKAQDMQNYETYHAEGGA